MTEDLTQDRLAANPYRTLGLSASARSAAIESAARQMRIWPDPQRIPPTPWDVPLLGPTVRSRKEIEQAIALLTEPASRLRARLLWYHGKPPPGADPAGDAPDGSSAIGTSADDADMASRHDAALGLLHAICFSNSTVVDSDQCEFVMHLFFELCGSADYQAWLSREEAEGDFEKRAAPDEVAAAIQSLPSALAAMILDKVEAAVDLRDPKAPGRFVALLRSAREMGNAAVVARLLDRLEDTVEAPCREIKALLEDKLRIDRTAPQEWYAVNYPPSLQAANSYNQDVHPAYTRFCRLADGEPARLDRVRTRCARLLALLGMGWEWAGEFITSEQTLHKALELGKGTPAEIDILNDLARVSPLAEEQRRKQQPVVPVASHRQDWQTQDLQLAASGATPQVARKPPMRVLPLAKPKSTGWSRAGWVTLIIVVVRVIASIAGNSSRSSSPPSSYLPSANSLRALQNLQPPSTIPPPPSPPDGNVTAPAAALPQVISPQNPPPQLNGAAVPVDPSTAVLSLNALANQRGRIDPPTTVTPAPRRNPAPLPAAIERAPDRAADSIGETNREP